MTIGVDCTGNVAVMRQALEARHRGGATRSSSRRRSGPGNSGFGGRPLGSRNKFAQRYIDDYYDVWQRKGIKALEDYADKQPAKFILVAAHLIPQHFKVEHEHKLSMLSDAELQQKLIEAKEELVARGHHHRPGGRGGGGIACAGSAGTVQGIA